MRRLPAFAAAIACAAVWYTPAGAQSNAGADYPARPVRVIVGLSPGGGTDVQARLIAQRMSENLHRPFVVENRTGAGGTLAYGSVAKSPPDGYTLLAVAAGYTITPAFYAKLAYDPVKDLAPISLVLQTPLLLAVHPALPVKNVRDLIALAKAKPGSLDGSSAGHGTTPHLALELFNSLAHVKIVHVPYKGSGQAMIDLIAGQVQLGFANIMGALPHVRAGKLKGLAVTSGKRSAALPEIPTIAESGVPGYEASSWHGWLGPAGTPEAIINKLATELATAIKSHELAERLTDDGGELVGSSPEAFQCMLVAEIARWRRVVKDARIRIE
jgi:tripartite-type tricarboxylate transporter receptor subunit TctC